MATSAIGPGFLTQTSLFTQQLLASFGFVILISVLIDIAAQLNIWRVVAINENYAQDIANKVFPGLGFFLAAIIAFGGLVFNIGNIAGCGLGLEVLTGVNAKTGAVISCVVALGVFWYKNAGGLMDLIVKILGLLMIGLTAYVAFSSRPPVGEALFRTIWPERIDVTTVVTLVGGTVGGYISFAGAHRLLDAGIKGKDSLPLVNRSAVNGILLTACMRFILFFAALGIVWHGVPLSDNNPAATVFQSAAGNFGYKFFGIVIWSAAITSVIGASYTSVSFWKTLVPVTGNNEKIVVSVFIIASALVFLLVGNPVKLLIMAGAVNGILLPVALAVMLISASKKKTPEQYRYPVTLKVAGWMVVCIMTSMAAETIRQNIGRL